MSLATPFRIGNFYKPLTSIFHIVMKISMRINKDMANKKLGGEGRSLVFERDPTIILVAICIDK